ncbi:PDDEXK nuclease domain-containing protein [Paraflavisolibacter sp. H34]|uniref:PDDEXK nuclease domain-containing protein n=1 Tax=Huijunlia imazamoxiresistens TaxID=3127457 RepID=UPI0030164AB1
MRIIDFKSDRFEPTYKGQMELYLRWLEKYETEAGEDSPIGLILCAEGNRAQIELLQLDAANIKGQNTLRNISPKSC